MKYSKTLLNYKNAVKGKLMIDRDQESLEWDDDLLLELINEGRHEYWNRLSASSRNGVVYANSVVNTKEVTIPETVDLINFVVYNNGTSRCVLRFIPEVSWAAENTTYVSGQPYAWTKRGNILLSSPAPSAAVTNGFEFWGRIGLTELAAETDVDGNVQDRWFPMVVDYIVGLAWESAEQQALANAKFAKFEKRMLDNGYEILSSQTAQDVSTIEDAVYIDETDQRRYGHLS